MGKKTKKKKNCQSNFFFLFMTESVDSTHSTRFGLEVWVVWRNFDKIAWAYTSTLIQLCPSGWLEGGWENIQGCKSLNSEDHKSAWCQWREVDIKVLWNVTRSKILAGRFVSMVYGDRSTYYTWYQHLTIIVRDKIAFSIKKKYTSTYKLNSWRNDNWRKKKIECLIEIRIYHLQW